MTSGPEGELSLRILWSLARWLEDHQGPAALDEVAQAAGLVAADFDGRTKWVSHAAFHELLERARARMSSDAEFQAAAVHRFQEAYGSAGFLVRALPQRQLYEGIVRYSGAVNRAGRFERLGASRNTFHVRYHCSVAEPRIGCLFRQAQWRAGPTMSGFPPADLEEGACIAHGDPYCEYRLRWIDRPNLLPVALGVAIGGGLAAAPLLLLPSSPAQLALASVLVLLSGTVAHVRELRRTIAANLANASGMREALRELVEAEAEARLELTALMNRQREWSLVLEQQVAERTAGLKAAVEGAQALFKSRVSSIRGVSHDLRNPLTSLRMNLEVLPEVSDAERAEVMADLRSAVDRMEGIIVALLGSVASDSQLTGTPTPHEVARLTDTVRRRLRAFAHGKDIKVSVFSSREAPDRILIDPLVLDRIVDNLLTNAAKYTDRGSIVCEVTGEPGELILKLSDTGRGIPPDAMETVFQPRLGPGSAESNGVGLSVVVRLLARLGGRLEVMSKPQLGTTFWAHIPVAPRTPPPSEPSTDDVRALVARVVKVRKRPSANPAA